MKRVLAICFAIMIVGSLVFAQTPNVQITFDQNYRVTSHTCSPPENDFFYVVAHNFNAWITGIEYKISFPAGIVFIADQLPDPENMLNIGQCIGKDMNPAYPFDGIAISWLQPQNGYQSVLCEMVWYNCGSCNPDSPIVVINHGDSGCIRATDYPYNNYIYGIGMTSTFCPETIPAESNTWGSVKALYE
jgi:hypothetical protein